MTFLLKEETGVTRIEIKHSTFKGKKQKETCHYVKLVLIQNFIDFRKMQK